MFKHRYVVIILVIKLMNPLATVLKVSLGREL